MTTTADIVIIGGGCMGANLAFSLARRDVLLDASLSPLIT